MFEHKYDDHEYKEYKAKENEQNIYGDAVDLDQIEVYGYRDKNCKNPIANAIFTINKNSVIDSEKEEKFVELDEDVLKNPSKHGYNFLLREQSLFDIIIGRKRLVPAAKKAKKILAQGM